MIALNADIPGAAARSGPLGSRIQLSSVIGPTTPRNAIRRDQYQTNRHIAMEQYTHTV